MYSLFSLGLNRAASIFLFALLFFLLPSCSDPELGSNAESSDTSAIGDSETVIETPLNAPSLGSKGGTLFERLSATETGVDYENGIVENHPLRQLYATEKVCGGVAAGDVDGNLLAFSQWERSPEWRVRRISHTLHMLL